MNFNRCMIRNCKNCKYEKYCFGEIKKEEKKVNKSEEKGGKTNVKRKTEEVY